MVVQEEGRRRKEWVKIGRAPVLKLVWNDLIEFRSIPYGNIFGNQMLSSWSIMLLHWIYLSQTLISVFDV